MKPLIKNPLLKILIKKRGWITTLFMLILLIFVSRTVNELGVNYMASLQDYNEEGIIRGAEPVYLEGNKDIGVLLIHGWSSSPSDFNELSEFLNQKGLTVYAPLLPGHGTHPKNLQNTKYEEWIAAVESSLNKLNTSKKFALGFSMGGALALDLASKKDLDGIVTLNAALFLASRYLPFIPLVKIVEIYTSKSPEQIMQFIDEKRIVYDSIPLNSITELQKLIESLHLYEVTEPIQIFQSENDKTILPESADYIYNNIQSQDKELIFLGNSTHSKIYNQEKAFEKVYEFIAAH